jgi:hypothetical protein
MLTRRPHIRLRNQRGMVLPLALGILAVLSIMVVTVITYSSSNSRHAASSKSRITAFNLAESGINNAASILNDPANNSKLLDPTLLPSRTTEYEIDSQHKGKVVWSGSFNPETNEWTLTSTGYYRNPTATNDIKRTLTATVVVVPLYTVALDNPVWDWIYSTRTGTTCDQQLNNNVDGSSRLYISGNLCIGNNAVVQQTTLIVKNDLWLANGNTAVGTTSKRVEVYVGHSCAWQGYNSPLWATPCNGDQDQRRIYSHLPNSTDVGVTGPSTPNVTPPTANWVQWYPAARPGPAQTCTAQSGTPPVFDTNYPSKDNSVPGTFEIGSATGWECRVGPPYSDECLSANRPPDLTCPTGYIRWEPPTTHPTRPGMLTVMGTIYIDGDIKLNNNLVNGYRGIGTIYLSGTFYLDGMLCGEVNGPRTDCDFPHWDPNNNMLTIVAEGSGSHDGIVPVGQSIFIQNNGRFQGSLFAKNGLQFGNVAESDGPMVASFLVFGNNVVNDSFPHIGLVGAGMPGNTLVLATVNAPKNFTG